MIFPLLIIPIHSPCILVNVSQSFVMDRLILSDPTDRFMENKSVYETFQILYHPAVWTPPISLFCSDRTFQNRMDQMLFNNEVKSLLLGLDYPKITPLVNVGKLIKASNQKKKT